MSEERRGRRLQQRMEREDKDAYDRGLASLVSTPHGRRFLWLFCLSLGLEDTAFTADRESTDFRLGRKSAAEELMKAIRDDHHEQHLQLLKENNDVHQQRMAEAAALGDPE